MPITDRVVGAAAVQRVQTAVGSRGRDFRDNFGVVDLVCDPDALIEVVTTLRDEVDCRFFGFLSAVDRSELDADKTAYAWPLEVLIHLYSPDHGTNVIVHVPIDVEKRTCPSISEVFGGALWHERECFEMFAIDFEGHPRLVNLYLPEDFEGNPGLRSFRLPTRTAVKPWPGAKDPEEAAGGGK